MTCMGVVKNFQGMVVCRVLLGFFEVSGRHRHIQFNGHC
jgi:hypothetical protein